MAQIQPSNNLLFIIFAAEHNQNRDGGFAVGVDGQELNVYGEINEIRSPLLRWGGLNTSLE